MDAHTRPGRSLIERLEEFEQVFQAEDPWSFLTSRYEQARHRLTLDLVPPCGLALEVGCAEGVFTEMLAGHVGRVIAFDFSRTALDRARKRCAHHTNVSFALADLVTVEFPEAFDVVVATEVLGYLEEWRMASLLAKMARWLHPGGLLITNPPMGRSAIGFST